MAFIVVCPVDRKRFAPGGMRERVFYAGTAVCKDTSAESGGAELQIVGEYSDGRPLR